ncbi:tRNA lysidine(34) synthetase TilS [Flavobacteriaceae bacterium]|nr:tRNA lysidine(34) synthetase TilS [Flavobacteriaceae bacterium]
MFQKFKIHLTNHFPQLKDQKLLLALSGGVDSCVLLDLCLKSGLRPAVAHCNFQLRGSESDRDAEWITNLSERKGLECHTQTFGTQVYALKKKLSIQVAARDLRYHWFESLSQQKGYDLILTAHHGDDALETFMINVMRGSGLRGLLGIPEQRGKILRPLLPFSRDEIKAYAIDNKIEWREDASNAKTDYLRNALRHDVIPQWKKRDPNFDGQFQETLKYLGQAQTVLDAVLTDFKKQNFIPQEEGFKIATAAFEGISSLDYYLHALFAPYGFGNLADLKKLMDAQSGKQLFSESHRLIKNREFLLLSSLEKSSSESYIINADMSSIGQPLKLVFSYEKSFKKGDTKSLLLDKSKLKFPLTLRKWKQSDYFYPNGLGGKKKLSKFFKDEKFSILDKESQWLLCSGEDIVWVVGKRADQRFLATPTSENIWLVRFDD